MPVTYEIDADRSLIRTRCVGATTFAEVMDHFRTLRSDPAIPEQMSVLLDLTEQTSAPEAEPHFTSTRVFRDRAPAEAWLASRGRAS